MKIGVFDSGTGGLTVLDAIVNYDEHNNKTREKITNGDNQRDFNEEYFIYLGDKANMPYGAYSGNHKTDLLKEHILKDMQFLLGLRIKQNLSPQSCVSNFSRIYSDILQCWGLLFNFTYLEQ